MERFFGSKPVYEQIQFLCGLAALHVARAYKEQDRQVRMWEVAACMRGAASGTDITSMERGGACGKWCMQHAGCGEACANESACMHVHMHTCVPLERSGYVNEGFDHPCHLSGQA